MPRKKLRFTCFLLVVFTILLSLLPTAVTADTPPIPYLDRVGGVLLLNMECGTVVYERQANTRVMPASTTKIMTSLIAIEHMSDRMYETVTVPAIIPQMTAGLNMGLQANEEIEVRYLLAANIISGANDAAMMLAYLVSGSQQDFVELMNQRAEEWGMFDTNYVNATGIDGEGARTTPHDVSRIALRAKECRVFMRYAGQATFIIPPTNLSAQQRIYNRNYLVSGGFILPVYGRPEVNGLNAGNTEGAGTVVVATASVNNTMLMAIVFGGSNRYAGQVSFSCHLAAWALISWAGENYSYQTVFDRSSIVGEISVAFARGSDYITVVPRDTVVLFLNNNADTDEILTTRIEWLGEEFIAPVAAETVVGTIFIYQGGRRISEMELITRNSLSLNQWQYIITGIYNIVSSTAFLIGALVFAIICVWYILTTAGKRYRKQEQERIAHLKKGDS
ncbi:MAG: D-alanyl-D-alanine carboxypeptidase [Oscillospiraceae bacterium]|nr:D-alanyl-D-alanine carboxypeptidase [Oscillospiraceae bacterium]